MLVLILLCTCCTSKEEFLFRQIEDSGVSFNNELNYTQELNPYTYRNYYNGAGVAIADFDNDGLEDLVFTGNQVDNKIYKNIGGFKFEDVTSLSDLDCSGSWSTGVSVIDINQDGLDDIYICKAGPPDGPRRYNELFINQGDFKFEERAEDYGLRIKGFSVHASFFDFDKDGDLDCYLLNNSIRSVGGYDLRPGLRDINSTDGNMLLVNENGTYVNRSEELGIYTSAIGFGLGVNTSDINGDGWIDIYVANDFFEKDYLYINQEGKGFIESGEAYFNAYSMGSMGVDVADIDDDGDKDIFVAEMAPKGIKRKKTKATYESWNKYSSSSKAGYYFQFPRNVLHLNQGEHFSEISRSKGIDASEWSWAPIIFDINNDGQKDLFISNGVGKDLLDRDYLAFMADQEQISNLLRNRNKESLKKLIDIMPSQKQHNEFFIQDEELSFNRVETPYGSFLPTTSNGAAIGDLDNDGDFDLVITNIGDKATILENQSTNNFLVIQLKSSNNLTIGAQLTVEAKGRLFHGENNPYRGFQSSISQKVIVGLGALTAVDKIEVNWPSGRSEQFGSFSANETIVLTEGSGTKIDRTKNNKRKPIIKEEQNFKVDYPHRVFNEFNKERLLVSMLPSDGAVCDMQDINDAQALLVFGGSQNNGLKVKRINRKDFTVIDSFTLTEDIRSHVTDIHIFDSDNDGDLDIGICHGSRVFSRFSSELHDGIYVNEGSSFSYRPNAFKFDVPIVSGKMATYDFSGDGLKDVIISERVRDDAYGAPTRMYYFENLGANQFSLTDIYSPETGMITDVEVGDLNGDGTAEIVVASEWGRIEVLEIVNQEIRNSNFSEDFSASGLWREIHIVDLNNDGIQEILCGNQGTNSFFNLHHKLYVEDFDENGKVEQIITMTIDDLDYPVHDYDEIISQTPIVRSKAQSYAQYSELSISELFSPEQLKDVLVAKIDELRSGMYTYKAGSYHFIPFPDPIQYSSMFAIESDDFNEDGLSDIIIGGNHYLYKPQFGRDDASRGHIIFGKGGHSAYEFGDILELGINGEMRSLISNQNGFLLVDIHGEDLKIVTIEL